MRFDIAMPLTLFTITAVTVFLSRIIEGKLKFALGEREFRVRDAVLLVAAISVTVSLIIFVPGIAVITLFLFAYSVLLFIFTFLFVFIFADSWVVVFWLNRAINLVDVMIRSPFCSARCIQDKRCWFLTLSATIALKTKYCKLRGNGFLKKTERHENRKRISLVRQKTGLPGGT